MNKPDVTIKGDMTPIGKKQWNLIISTMTTLTENGFTVTITNFYHDSSID